MAVTRPVLRYYGGKYRLAPWIISHFPPHRLDGARARVESVWINPAAVAANAVSVQQVLIA